MNPTNIFRRHLNSVMSLCLESAVIRREFSCTSVLNRRRSFVMRKDQTDKHNELIEIDKTDKHRYYRWKYRPLPTQTSLDDSNPMFAIRSPDFKLPNVRGRLHKKIWRQRICELQEARKDVELEKLARTRKLMIPLDEVEKQWQIEFGLFDVQNLAKFYGITKDLFGSEDIVLDTWIDVAFNDVRIHRGNIVEAAELTSIPCISYNGSRDGPCDHLCSLIVSNLDGHPFDPSKQLIHWMVCNIKRADIASGQTVFEYLPTTPWKGTGYNRLVFTLYKHKHPIEGLQDMTSLNPNSIRTRSLSLHSLTSNKDMAPAGLAWCQVTWDGSVSENWKQFSDLQDEPIFDWEEFVEPKIKNSWLKTKLSELKYRNM